MKVTLEIFNDETQEQLTMEVAKLSEHAYLPTRGSEFSAGHDLYSAYYYIVPSKGKALIKTDIQVHIPDGHYGRIAPRSGLAINNFLDIGAGVVDVDYRGNVGIVLFNFGNQDFKVNRGDRIAQLICEKISIPVIKEVKSLADTDRGNAGFGSTGNN